MPNPATPAETFAALIDYISRVVVSHAGWDQGMPSTLIGAIIDRLRGFKLDFIRLATRIRDGQYKPRTVAPHPRAANFRRPGRLPRKFGWLEPLMAETVPFRAHLDWVLQDAEVRALLESGPDSLRRPLRSLCHMLGYRPPPILARPRRAAPEPPAPAKSPPPPPRPPVRMAPLRRPRAAPTPAIAKPRERRKPA